MSDSNLSLRKSKNSGNLRLESVGEYDDDEEGKEMLGELEGLDRGREGGELDQTRRIPDQMEIEMTQTNIPISLGRGGFGSQMRRNGFIERLSRYQQNNPNEYSRNDVENILRLWDMDPDTRSAAETMTLKRIWNELAEHGNQAGREDEEYAVRETLINTLN